MSLKTFLIGIFAGIFADVAVQGLLFVSHSQSLLPFSNTGPQAGHVATLHSKVLFFFTLFLGLSMVM